MAALKLCIAFHVATSSRYVVEIICRLNLREVVVVAALKNKTAAKLVAAIEQGQHLAP